MNIKGQQDFLKKEIAGLKAKFKSDRIRHKYLALILKGTSVTFAGIITVLLGWKELVSVGSDQIPISLLFGDIALILGAFITLVTAYDAFFHPRILWIRETKVYTELSDLERDFEYACAGANDGALEYSELEKYKDRLSGIMGDSLKEWLRLRGEQAEQKLLSPDK